MAKMWAGRTDGETNSLADDFNSSISFDSRMYKEDIRGSIAHASMLGKKNIISSEDAEKIITELMNIERDIDTGKLPIDMTAEDIHMFIESVLTERLGDVGKKLHTARSRNDQVALDFRMNVMKESDEIVALVKDIIRCIIEKSEEYYDTIMPGFTHLQHAQPITFGHELMAYAMMFLRDIGRLTDAKRRMDVCPIGSCALAGTTYTTDREYEAEKLGFSEVALNSIDGVSDRDFALEFLSALAVVMMHLSRFSEEIILWASDEFSFITLSDDFTTGSSIMPQKKNPDMAELVRGKTGRVYGDLLALLTTLKGIPLAYNKDMQEDKEGVFDAIDTVKLCLQVFTGMLGKLKANPEKMYAAAKRGFLNATDLADYLVKKGMPFREAYKISGTVVRHCIEKDTILEDLPIEEYKNYSDVFQSDVYEYISLENCVRQRKSLGGTSPESVLQQIEYVKSKIQ